MASRGKKNSGDNKKPKINRITFKSLRVDPDKPDCPLKKNGGKHLIIDQKDELLDCFAEIVKQVEKIDLGSLGKIY